MFLFLEPGLSTLLQQWNELTRNIVPKKLFKVGDKIVCITEIDKDKRV